MEVQTTNCIATDTQLQPLMLEHEGQQPEDLKKVEKIFAAVVLSEERSFLLLRALLFLVLFLITYIHIYHRKMAPSSYKCD